MCYTTKKSFMRTPQMHQAVISGYFALEGSARQLAGRDPDWARLHARQARNYLMTFGRKLTKAERARARARGASTVSGTVA
jgi:hypothetical protein